MSEKVTRGRRSRFVRSAVVAVGVGILGLIALLIADDGGGQAETVARAPAAAYVTYDPETRAAALLVVEEQGPARTLATRERGAYFDVEWAPDGSAIAVATGVDATQADLFLVDPASGEQTLVAAGGTDAITGLAWNPDSSEIAFARRAPDGAASVEAVRRDGTERRVLAGSASYEVVRDFGCSAVSPTALVPYEWSPDGSELLVGASAVCGEDLFADIATVPASRGVPLRLVDTASAEMLARWSPSGDRVAFESASGINVVRRDGSGLTTIAPGTSPTWVDDDNVGFVRRSGPGAEVTFAPVGSSAPARRVVSTSSGISAPAMAADGQTVWFLSDSPSGTSLQMADLGGGRPRRLSTEAADILAFDLNPAYAPAP